MALSSVTRKKRHSPLRSEQIDSVAQLFRVLSEPTRLRIIHTLGYDSRSVSELVKLTGLPQANVSKHLAVLHQAGIVLRTRTGSTVVYRAADDSVFALCDIVCGCLKQRLKAQYQHFS